MAITIVTIALMSLLAYSTVFGIEAENNITFLEAEGNALRDRVGDWFGYLFWIIGATSLFAAALGIVDYTCRLVADVLKVSYLRENESGSESRIYFLLVWLLVVWSAIILLAIRSQPLILLIISASIGTRSRSCSAAGPRPMCRFLLTVAIALVVWLVLAALAALLGLL